MASMPIVVATDGSEQAGRAVEWAAREAVRRGATLRIVSVPAMPSRMRAYDSSPATVAHFMREYSAAALSAAAKRAGEVAPRLPADTELLTGPPATALIASAAGAAMLVVGARGGGGFGAMALGSVSRYAALHAPGPVVVAREDTMAVHRKVAVGVADPAEAGDSLGFAFEEASLRGARLTVVHAVHHFRLAAPRHGPVAPGPGEAAAAAELEKVLAEWQDKYPEVRVQPEVVWGHPGQVLAGYSAHVDLLVVGRHGVPEGAANIGSILHPVLGHAHSAVAIIPSAH
ncbi:MAG: universal stress protein [Streptosporangiaceae bacterium]